MKKNHILLFSLSLFCFALNPAFGSPNTKGENHCITEMKNNEHTWAGGVLGMPDCQLQDEDMLAVADYLKNKPEIVGVFFKNNQLTSKGATLLANIQTLHDLTLDDNLIDNDGAKALGEAKNITSLSLSNNKINDAGVAYLAKSESLTQLALSGLVITWQGAEALANNQSITFLELNNDNALNDFGAIALSKSKTLHTLYLENDHITDFGVSAFKETRIDILDLSHNSLTDKATVDLATIKSTTLGLSNMAFTSQGIATLAANRTIKNLFLMSDQLSDNSLRPLAENHTIESLFLDNNKIQGDGLKYFIPNSGLQTLWLNNNEIDDTGAFYIAHNHNDLSFLWLSKNKLTNEGAYSLASYAKLKQLDVSYNHIGPKGIAALHSAMGSNVNTEGNDGINASHTKSKYASYQYDLLQKRNKNTTYQIWKNSNSFNN